MAVMRTTPIVALVAAAACGGTSPSPVPRRPMGVQAHLAEADRHEADARHHDQQVAAVAEDPATATYTCGDRAMSDQSTSGGERLVLRAPCWTAGGGSAERHRQVAERLRTDAAAHRARARVLLQAEARACSQLPEEERDHTPFHHYDDILAVSAELDGDRLAGARIKFRPVPNLSAEWMRQALGCHSARAAAIGWPTTFMADCPSVVAGAETTVLEEPDGLVVVVRAKDPAAALVIYARAEQLLDPPTSPED